MTLEVALNGIEIPTNIRKELTIVDVPHISFDEKICEGQIVVHNEIAKDISEIFNILLKKMFPIMQVIPIVHYGWDDSISMIANNSSGFNYRLITGTNRLSNHSYGRAVDINPMQNPYTQLNGITVPRNSLYEITEKGTITEEIAQVFKSYGFGWYGDRDQKDWQHFEKVA